METCKISTMSTYKPFIQFHLSNICWTNVLPPCLIYLPKHTTEENHVYIIIMLNNNYYFAEPFEI